MANDVVDLRNAATKVVNLHLENWPVTRIPDFVDRMDSLVADLGQVVRRIDTRQKAAQDPTKEQRPPVPAAGTAGPTAGVGEQRAAVGADPASPAPAPEVRWRVGRKVGRTVYRDGVLVGVLDTPELAAQAVAALNAQDDAVRAAVAMANNRAADAFHAYHFHDPAFDEMDAYDFEAWLRSGEPAPGAVP